MTRSLFRHNKVGRKVARSSYRQPGQRQPRFEQLEDRSLLSAVTVTTFADVVNPNDGKLSLREAINMANDSVNYPTLDTIQLKSGTYKIQIPGTGDDNNVSGDFDIDESLKIVGAWSKRSSTVIDARALDRVFDIPEAVGIDVTFENVKITGGVAVTPILDVQGGGVRSFLAGNDLCFINSTVTRNQAAFGGGIFNQGGDISLQNSHVDNNIANVAGGGIYLGGVVTFEPLGEIIINCSTVNGNSVSGERSGGGIYSSSTEAFILNKSELSNNHSSGSGGGAYLASEDVSITGSCVSGNTSGGDGGGLNIEYALLGEDGAIHISNSTFSKNIASGDGGGLDANGLDVTVRCSTFSCNQAGEDGGGIANAFTVDVTGSSFLNNSTLWGAGGGIHQQELTIMTPVGFGVAQVLPQSGDINVLKSTFKGNFAGWVGGGIASVGLLDFETIDVTDSCFIANTSIGDGGGIYAGLHSVNVVCSTFDKNVAGGSGGGVYVPVGDIDVNRSTFLKNRAGGDGGGFAVTDGNVTVADSTLECNVATNDGGGFYSYGETLTMTGSTVSGNRAGGYGGGIDVGTGDTTGTSSSIVNCTFSGNSAGVGGGGINFEGEAILDFLNINFVTIAFNTAAQEGGGIRLGSGTLTMQNTILAKNLAANGPNFYQVGGSVFIDLGNNLIYGGGEGVTEFPGSNNVFANPKLQPLADNGGPTKTHALKSDSPAIGAANPGTGVTTDQRGVSRDATPDIGAYEFVASRGKKRSR